jgi:hypothetical protein
MAHEVVVVALSKPLLPPDRLTSGCHPCTLLRVLWIPCLTTASSSPGGCAAYARFLPSLSLLPPSPSCPTRLFSSVSLIPSRSIFASSRTCLTASSASAGPAGSPFAWLTTTAWPGCGKYSSPELMLKMFHHCTCTGIFTHTHTRS